MIFFTDMRAPWLFLLCLCLPLSVFSKVSIQTENQNLQYYFQIEDFKVVEEEVDGKKFQKLALEGVDSYTGLYHKKGQPELPVLRFYVYGNGEVTVERTSTPKDENNLVLPHFLRATDSVPKVLGAKKKFSLDEPLSLDAISSFEVKEMGTVRGQRQRLVTLFPVFWEAKSGRVQKFSEFKVKVSQAEERTPNDSKTIVIVVADRFQESEALARLIEHKKSLGFQVQKIVVSAENKDAKAIRELLREAYEQNAGNLKYVLLVGNPRLLPGYRSPRLKAGFTDHYYRCLDNENYEEDIGAPDVAVGRISIKEEEELSTITDKIIQYEKAEFRSGEWLKRISHITTNDPEHWQVSEESSNYSISKYLSSKGFSGNFPEKNLKGGDKLYAHTYKASGKDVLAAVNEGRAFIQYSGHGLSSLWDYPRFSVADVAKLQNTGAIPFVVANACDTAKITAPNSIAEAWLKHPYGAIFYWGAVDIAYWEEDAVFQKKMSDEVFGNGNLEIGSFTYETLADVWRYWGGEGESKYYWEIYLSLGDPSLKLHLK